jgi:hypothetical protein
MSKVFNNVSSAHRNAAVKKPDRTAKASSALGARSDHARARKGAGLKMAWGSHQILSSRSGELHVSSQRHYLTATLTLLKKGGLHTIITAAEDCTCIWTKLPIDVVLECETARSPSRRRRVQRIFYPRLPAKQHVAGGLVSPS